VILQNLPPTADVIQSGAVIPVKDKNALPRALEQALAQPPSAQPDTKARDLFLKEFSFAANTPRLRQTLQTARNTPKPLDTLHPLLQHIPPLCTLADFQNALARAMPTITLTSNRNELFKRCIKENFKEKNFQKKNVTIYQTTPSNTRNPFYTMINKHLDENFLVEYITDLDLVDLKCNKKDRGKSIVVFHQVEVFYHKGARNEKDVRFRAEKFIQKVREIKSSGAKIVWWKHNPLPHSRQFLKIDIEVEQAMFEIADRVVVMAQGAKKLLENMRTENFGKIEYIPHPDFRSEYGPLVTKREAREKLELNKQDFIFGSIGEIKPYKGLNFLVEIFAELETCGKCPQLVISGKSHDPYYLESLLKNKPSNVHVFPKEIPTDKISTWVCALDSSIFSFEDIWVSGSVILSLSYCVDAIVPEIGFLGEYVDHKNTGLLYRHKDRNSLILAVKERSESLYPQHYRYMCEHFHEKNSINIIKDLYHNLYNNLF
jgi:glycosyltransferase involved in cell wall biosynthesis